MNNQKKNNQKKRFWDKKKVLTLLIFFLTISLLLVYRESRVRTIPNTTVNGQAQFAIASDSWTFDEYGQGFENYTVFENITLDGEWNNVGAVWDHSDSHVFDWNVSYFIKIRIYAWMNSTLTKAEDVDAAKYLNRVNVTVTTFSNKTNVVFSEQNITCFYASDFFDEVLWLYGWEIILNFEPGYNEVYIVTFTQEVFY